MITSDGCYSQKYQCFAVICPSRHFVMCVVLNMSDCIVFETVNQISENDEGKVSFKIKKY